jgi:hypothetical protein
MSVEVGKDRSLGRRDPLAIKDKDPKMRYLWANKNLVEDNKDDGWEVLNKSQGGSAQATNDPRDKATQQADGTIQRRDAIVMVMPEEEAKRRFDRKEGLRPFDESREERG